MKHKNSPVLETRSYFSLFAVLIFLLMSIILPGMLVYLLMKPLLGRPGPIPIIEESIEVPLNSHGPIYTENAYSEWVSISISGSVERNGEFLHDAIHQYDDVQQGSQGGFRGFLIDGVYAFEFRAPGPNYRDDHIYRFSHSVHGFPRATGSDSPKTIGFQVINEAARGLDGVFIVEVSSDSFKHDPGGRGR